MTVDGTTQPGYPGTPIIELKGTLAGASVHGLRLTAGLSTVRGLVINSFATGAGLVLESGGTNVVQNNFLGTDFGSGVAVDGSLRNSIGLLVTNSSANLIGGTNVSPPFPFNVFSGNAVSGVRLENAHRNTMAGNFVGTDLNGTVARANGAGVIAGSGSTSNLIGGTVNGGRNYISANTNAGVLLQDAGTRGNRVFGNTLGADSNGSQPLPNGVGVLVSSGATSNLIGDTLNGAINDIRFNLRHGVELAGVSNNFVRGNYIQANGASGIEVGSGAGHTGNTLSSNRVVSNGGLGINLRPTGEAANTVTPNDALDADSGPNRLQNSPVLTNVTLAGSVLHVFGSLNAATGRTFAIEFFRSASPDPSGSGEGEFVLGSLSVTTDAQGNAPFDFTGTGVASNHFTATARDTVTGDTSEFSPALQLVPALSINDVVVTEGNAGTTPAVFTVSLAMTSAVPVTVSCATSNGTADAASDYFFTNQVITIPAGSSSAAFTVQVRGDTFYDSNELFYVRLSNPNPASIPIRRAIGTCTILNDDPVPPVIVTQPTNQSVACGGTASFTVSASGAPPLAYQWHFNGTNAPSPARPMRR